MSTAGSGAGSRLIRGHDVGEILEARQRLTTVHQSMGSVAPQGSM